MIVYAVSGASSNHYPNNSRTNFKNLISEPLDHRYSHCALEECYFEASFNTIVEPDYNMVHIAICSRSLVKPILDYIEMNDVGRGTSFRHIFSTPNYSITYATFDWDTSYVYVIVKSGVYKTLFSILGLLNSILKEAGVDDLVNFSQARMDGKCVLKTSSKFIYISQNLMRLLGFNNHLQYLYSAAQLGNLSIRTGLIQPGSFAMKYYAIFGRMTLKADGLANFDLFLPNLIKITSDEVHHSLVGSKLEKILSVIQGPQTNFIMFKHSILNPAVMELVTRGLKNLSFGILDQNNVPLKLGVGSACYLKLKMSEASTIKYNQLTLYSNDKDAGMMSPSTHTSDFTTPLAKRLHKNSKTKDWTMNLKRLALPSVINNITSDICGVQISSSHNPFYDISLGPATYKIELSESETVRYGGATRVVLPSGYFPSPAILKDKLNSVLIDHEVEIKMNSDNRYTISNISENSIQIVFNPVMNLVLGVCFGEIITQTLFLPANSDYKCRYEVDVNIARPRYARVVSSILKHTMFGAVNCKLLRFITLKHSATTDVCSYEFVNDSPMSIALTSLNTIDLKILNEHNDSCLEFANRLSQSTFSIEIAQE